MENANKKAYTFLRELSIGKLDNRKGSALLSILIDDLTNEFADVFTVVKGNYQLSQREVCESHKSLNENLNNILRGAEKGTLILS